MDWIPISNEVRNREQKSYSLFCWDTHWIGDSQSLFTPRIFPLSGTDTILTRTRWVMKVMKDASSSETVQYTTIQNTVAEAGKVVSLARAVLQRHPNTQAAFKHTLPRLHVNMWRKWRLKQLTKKHSCRHKAQINYLHYLVLSNLKLDVRPGNDLSSPALCPE